MRKQHRRVLLAFLVAALAATSVSACATSPPLRPIDKPGERWQFNGFSVVPPEGTDWNWVGHEGQDKSKFFNTTFVKKEGYRTYVAGVKLLDNRGKDLSDPDKLLSDVKNSGIMQESSRQKNMTSSFKIDGSLGIPCVRYDLDAEDTQVPGRPGEVFALDAHGFFCSHPMENDVTVWILYTRRSPKGTGYIAGKEEGERFLESLRFTTVNR